MVTTQPAFIFFFARSERGTVKGITQCIEDIIPLLFKRRDIAANAAKRLRALVRAKAARDLSAAHCC